MIPALAVAVLLSGCGEGGDQTYSAAPFGNCLQHRGASPGPIEVSTVDPEQIDLELGSLREEANKQLGSLEAFSGTEAFPEAGETAFLFLANGDAAKQGAKRVEAAARRLARKSGIRRKEPSAVRGNLLIVWPTQGPTRGQEETINACLKQAEAEE